MGVGICLVNNPHSLQWNPFRDNILTVACSNRPGHTPTSGMIYFLEFLPKNQIEIETQVQLNIGCDQICCSHRDENTVMSSCDDRVLRLFDLKKKDCMYREFFDGSPQNTRSLDWDRITLENILSGGSDEKVKIYNVLQDDIDEATHIFSKHNSYVMDSIWNRHAPYQLLSCDQSGFAYLWDMNQSKNEPAMKFKLHNETCAMRMDQNIFDENSVAFGTFESSLMTYDLRNVKCPKAYVPRIHYSMITDTKFSPHTQHLVATSSTDRTLRLWDMRDSANSKLNSFTSSIIQNPSSSEKNESPSTSNNPKDDSFQQDMDTGTLETAYGGKISSFKPQKVDDWVNSLDWNYHEVGLIAFACNDHLTKAYNIKED